jgi:hypothetical protein
MVGCHGWLVAAFESELLPGIDSVSKYQFGKKTQLFMGGVPLKCYSII